MPRFFVPSTGFDGDIVRITGDDARHIARALRMAAGETVTVCDMHGTTHTCVLERITDAASVARIVASTPSDTEPPYPVTLYQAFPKGDKMDAVVQKAVESGACAVVPFLSERCVSRPDDKSVEKKIARWQRIALEAAKQCGRGIIPEVRRPLWKKRRRRRSRSFAMRGTEPRRCARCFRRRTRRRCNRSRLSSAARAAFPATKRRLPRSTAFACAGSGGGFCAARARPALHLPASPTHLNFEQLSIKI